MSCKRPSETGPSAATVWKVDAWQGAIERCTISARVAAPGSLVCSFHMSWEKNVSARATLGYGHENKDEHICDRKCLLPVTISKYRMARPIMNKQRRISIFRACGPPPFMLRMDLVQLEMPLLTPLAETPMARLPLGADSSGRPHIIAWSL